MSSNTTTQQAERLLAFRQTLQAKSLQAIKLEVIVPALYQIADRLEAQANDATATQDERRQAKSKLRYWNAVLTLAFAGYLQ